MLHTLETATDWNTLIDDARNGCDQSLGEIAAHVHRYLMTIAGSGLGAGLQSKFSASDVVQISMMEAQEDIASFGGSTEAEMRCWLKRIVVRNLADEAKRYTRAQSRDVRREVRVDGTGLASVGSCDETPSWHVSRQETDLELLRAIDALPPRQRFVVKARFREGLEYPEIARQLHISEPAARQLWTRAADKLRALIGQTE